MGHSDHSVQWAAHPLNEANPRSDHQVSAVCIHRQSSVSTCRYKKPRARPIMLTVITVHPLNFAHV